jgi:hypothetical protein
LFKGTRDVSQPKDHPNPATDLRFAPEAILLGQCRLDLFRGSGPGGQKRNKTSNAVRLTHLPTNISVICQQTRSQSLNKRLALRQLRLRLAIELREPVDLPMFAPPDWFLEIRTPTRIVVSHRHPFYAPAIGLVLDLMAATDANPARVAALLGVSTTAILRLVENAATVWTAANRLRAHAGQPPLTHRR